MLGLSEVWEEQLRERASRQFTPPSLPRSALRREDHARGKFGASHLRRSPAPLVRLGARAGLVALGLAVGLLVRYGPADRRRARWASVGAVVAAWIVQALLFSWYVGSFANFMSASGALTVFLVLTAFFYTASILFLVGVEIDELLRKDASTGEDGFIAVLRAMSR